jgi:Cu/Ag efflux protein CusF
MRHALAITAVVVVVLMVVGGAIAQIPPPAAPGAGAPARAQEPARAPEPSGPWDVEGTVKKVDPVANTVGIATGWFGFLGRTLQVTDQTEIRIAGRDGSLHEIREGAKVKASYEVRDGKSVARSLEVSPLEDPARPPAPAGGQPRTQ